MCARDNRYLIKGILVSRMLISPKRVNLVTNSNGKPVAPDGNSIANGAFLTHMYNEVTGREPDGDGCEW